MAAFCVSPSITSYAATRPAHSLAVRHTPILSGHHSSHVQSSKVLWGGSLPMPRSHMLQISRSAYSQQSAEEVQIGEVSWSPELVNTIYLLGRTGSDVDLKYFQEGKVKGQVSVAVKSRKAGSQDDSMWVKLEIWGPLAEAAAAAVHKGQLVAIQGRLKIDGWTASDGQRRSMTVVVVNQLKRVTGYQDQTAEAPTQEALPSGGGMPQATRPPAGGGRRAGQAAVNPKAAQLENQWLLFFEDPSAYYDNRKAKASGEKNPKYPDFKHKITGDVLWVDSYNTPAWVKASLEEHDNNLQARGKTQKISLTCPRFDTPLRSSLTA
eukprot:CAMPEP_0117676648 /NCGR_PEP_ID=MMETSP0804-20121206/16299_1 /TAXON_ID=1074897 /ORGANISM="Tetraselmis astigmatica, Strain CCMP880" /LENGTH=321 /DNA_ID=CAMNT_0005485829 /DNA_START=218 /DNA_END=1184 /DNA_ORIENTATION=+